MLRTMIGSVVNGSQKYHGCDVISKESYFEVIE